MMFIDDENYQKSVEDDRPLKDLYSEYKSYCLDSGYGLCSIRTFSSRLKKSGFTVKRKSYGNAVFIERRINLDF